LSVDGNVNDEPTEARIKQYERLTEDWRFHHKLIWEIPTVAVAIIAGILVVSYTQLQSSPVPRIVLLILSGVLLFGLTAAVVKHRFGADYRTANIMQAEQDLGIPVLPLETRQARDRMKMEGKPYTNNWLSRLVIDHVSAEVFLIGLTFLATVLMIGLAGYEIMAALGLMPNIVPSQNGLN
jgi:type III secretory pathway component EscS